MALHFLTADATTAVPGDEVVLTGAEAHHAASVRRIRVDEKVTLGDGAGVWLDGVCVAATPREVTVRVDGRRTVAAPGPRLVLVQALAKGDRDELAVQAATELGVDRIVPWAAERSVSRWDGKEAKALARWRTIVREAAKQAHRAWVPDVLSPVTTAQLAQDAADRRVLVLEPTAVQPLSAVDLRTDHRDIVFVVGPEGGISARESELLSRAGAEPVRLGESVLRTSTAGAAALSIAQVLLGRW